VTDATGVAGQTGIVYGGTTPSVTKVEVIGDISDDHASAVKVEGRAESLWFAENLLEFIDHQPGTTMSIADRRFTRDGTRGMARGRTKLILRAQNRDQCVIAFRQPSSRCGV
jgi:hypothetical protein